MAADSCRCGCRMKLRTIMLQTHMQQAGEGEAKEPPPSDTKETRKMGLGGSLLGKGGWEAVCLSQILPGSALNARSRSLFNPVLRKAGRYSKCLLLPRSTSPISSPKQPQISAFYGKTAATPRTSPPRGLKGWKHPGGAERSRRSTGTDNRDLETVRFDTGFNK